MLLVVSPSNVHKMEPVCGNGSGVHCAVFILVSALEAIEKDLYDRVAELKAQDKLLEAQRLEQRTQYDMEMMREIGYCQGIENYSRYFDGRSPGQPPYTLIDYFPEDFLMIIDESHVTLPQVRVMYHGDLSRKSELV